MKYVSGHIGARRTLLATSALLFFCASAIYSANAAGSAVGHGVGVGVGAGAGTGGVGVGVSAPASAAPTA
jgi:hypothetical protein